MKNRLLSLQSWKVLKNNSRIISFDFGLKNIGIALTDPLFLFATPFKTIKRTESMKEDIKLIQTELSGINVVAFVIGVPYRSQGEEGTIHSHIKGFEKKIKKAYPDIPVYSIDEASSTSEAKEKMNLVKKRSNFKKEKKSGRVDAAAAAVILERFMGSCDFASIKKNIVI